MTITISGKPGEGKSLAAAVIIDALQMAGCEVEFESGRLSEPIDAESAADTLRSIKPEITVVERVEK